MDEITVKKIDKTNWQEALKIRLKPEQKDLAPDVVTSLATAYIKPWDEMIDVFGLEYDKRLIGFFYVSYTPDSKDNYWLGGYQIDRDYQGKGFGGKAFKTVLKYIREIYPICEILSLTVIPGNEVATHIYELNGFTSSGKANSEGETIYRKII